MADVSRLPRPLAAIWEWQLQGACRQVDPEVFFHPEGERSPQRKIRDRAAVAVCAACPVIAACRRHALAAAEPYGVWGGLTVEDRGRFAGRERHVTAHPDTPTFTDPDLD